MRKVLKSGIGGASGCGPCGNSESGICWISSLTQVLHLTTMSAIFLQLTGHSRPSLLRMQPYFRTSRRISGYHFATPSWSSTFLRRKPITGPFTNRPIFTSALLSLRRHPSQNSHQPKTYRFFEFLDKIPENVVFYGIIGINSVVFMMWYMAEQKFVREDLPCHMSSMDFQLASYRNNKAIRRLSYI
jgi:hypothetical protein